MHKSRKIRWLNAFALFTVALAGSIVLLDCTGPSGHPFSELSVSATEQRLDSITQVTRNLADYDDAEKIFLNYSIAVNLMDLVPDSSEVKAKSRLFFMNKLNVNGGAVEAIKQGWKAVHMKDGLHDDGSLYFRYQAFSTMASMYNSLGFEDSCLRVQNIAVEEADLYSEPFYKTGPLNNLGIYLNKFGFPDSALACFLEADRILTVTKKMPRDFELLHGSVRDNIATIYEDRGLYEEAARLYALNIELYKNSIDTFRYHNAVISLLNAEIELGHQQNAWEMISLIEPEMASASNDLDLANHIYFERVKLNYYIRTNDLANQLTTSNHLIALQNQELKQEVVRKANSLSFMRFNARRFDQLIKAEQQAKEDEARRARLRFYILLLLAAGVLFTSLFFIILNRQRGKLIVQKNALLQSEKRLQAERINAEIRERKLLQVQLENKKKDLSDMVLHLSSRQSWARELDQRIKLIEALKGTQRSREFRALKDEIKRQVNIDKDLSVLLEDIEVLNSAFYEELTNRFPGLSKTEKKLCSFIRLRLTNSQIAQVQNINADSVRMGRHRLRAKLNLPPEQNLDEFLQSL